MSYKFESEVTKALGELLNSETNYDVIIYIGVEPDFKEFHAHSIFLCCRSQYFNSILSVTNKIDGKYIIKKPNITPQAFDVIIKYFYTGHVDITNKTGNEILNLILAFDELKLNQLINLAEDFFIENRQQFLRNNPIEILQMIYYHKTFNKIQEFCLEMICFEPEILFDSVNKFVNLSPLILEVILKRDDLNLVEIKVWEILIKWGLAQENTLNEDISKWEQEDFNTFKRIIYKFIPLIRFCEISSEDYYNKVRPYEEVLSKELREEILKFHMVPGYKPILFNNFPRYYIDSILINQKYTALFAKWIDRKEESTMNNDNHITIPYKFNLLYRASRDGNQAGAFHEKCDHIKATIIVVKIEDSEQIVGGYNPLEWDKSGTYKSTIDSFMFSFTDRMNLKISEIVYSNGDLNSIGCFSNCGPVFGFNNLYINYNRNVWSGNSISSSYPAINLPSSFNAEDYEVFQVVKK